MNEPLFSADHAWVRDLKHVFKYGYRVSPRGMLVYEALAYTSVVDMTNPIIFNEQRKLGYKFMAAEAAWILSGNNNVESIAPYSKEISKFSDNGITFFGAYGPPIVQQLPYVVKTIENDENTRQAVLTIWRQSPEPSRDIPCTIALQWLVRLGSLHCVATMRSSDLWLGHPYDIFNFSAVSFRILLELNNKRREEGKEPLELGTLHLTAGSKHIYDKNIEDVGHILDEYYRNGVSKYNEQQSMKPAFVESRYDSHEEFISHLWSVAEEGNGAKALLGR